MHHFIFPSKDTYITSRPGYSDKNFGIDEILQVGTTNTSVLTLNQSKNYSYVNATFATTPLEYFTGIFTGSFAGTIAYSTGSISGSFLDFSASYFVGTIDSVPVSGSGLVSGSMVNVSVSGSIIAPYSTGLFIGQVTGSEACFSGTGSGIDVRNRNNWATNVTQYIDRSILKFDLSEVSSAMAAGEVTNPRFYLRMKIDEATELPIIYTVYALPVSQSWNMGDGYFSDGGSDEGVSWKYLNNNHGQLWYDPYISGTRPPIDYISNPANSTSSFGYGGGTWNTIDFASQSFTYTTADINMDVTTMALKWLNGTYPNEGLILVHSDEMHPTGSGFILQFFSKDTNTIYSPYLDLMWSDSTFVTGSVVTSSVTISTASVGITGIVNSGSMFSITGGVHGVFSASTNLNLTDHYVTASNQYFAPSQQQSIVWYNYTGLYGWEGEYGWTNGYDVIGWGNYGLYTPPLMPAVLGSAPVLKFTGSFTGSFLGTAEVWGLFTGSGQFSSSYFAGLLDGIPAILSGSVSASNIQGLITSSAIMQTQFGTYTGQLTASSVILTGTGSGYYLDQENYFFSGFLNGIGYAGNIAGVPVYGNATGFITTVPVLITGSCGSAYSGSIVSATFSSGPFSGSTFQAYYVDYQFQNARLTGSWIPETLLGAYINIPLPSGIDPYAYAYVNGLFVSGKALGLYVTSGSTSASFDGQFIDGNLLGGHLYVQISGSVYTSSFAYTSSVSMTSSLLSPLDVDRSFTIALQGLKPSYKMGDQPKIGVFGRKQYPLKTFAKVTQQEQYMVPEFLPTSSFYAIKDNQTEEIMLNFDSYTQINCEYPYGNYFILDTTSFMPERYYRILIQVQDSDNLYTIDTGKTFKITR